MSVDFSAKIILGYYLDEDEIDNFEERFGEDFRDIEDEYIIVDDSYSPSNYFFVVSNIARTGSYTEVDFEDIVCNESENRIEKFYELLPNRKNEKPKYYLIQEVW